MAKGKATLADLAPDQPSQGQPLVTYGKVDESTPASAASQPSMWERAKNLALNPLVDAGSSEKSAREFSTGLPTEFDINHPVIGGALKGIAGAGADTMSTLRGFTSPVSLATMGLGAAGKIPGAVGTLAKTSNALAGAGLAYKGGSDAVEAAPKALEGDPDAIQKALFGGASVAGGASALTPGKSVGNYLENKSYDTMNNVMGVYGRDLKYGINPGRGVVQEGIAGSSKKAILGKIDQRIPELSDELNTTASSPALAGRTVNIDNSVNQPFRTALAAGDEAPSPYLTRLLQTQKELTQQRTINAQDRPEFTGQPKDLSKMDIPAALLFKRNVGARTNFENDSVGQNINPILKQVYGGVNSDIRTAAPEIAPTLNRLADLQQGGESLDAAIGRRLASPSSGIRDVAPAVVGSAMGGAPLAVGAILGRELFGSTPVKSYGAQLMFKGGKAIQNAPQIPYGAIAAALAASRKR